MRRHSRFISLSLLIAPLMLVLSAGGFAACGGFNTLPTSVPTIVPGAQLVTPTQSTTLSRDPITGRIGAVVGPGMAAPSVTALAATPTNAIATPHGPTPTFGALNLVNLTSTPTRTLTATPLPTLPPPTYAGPTNAFGPVIGPNYTAPPPPTAAQAGAPPAVPLPTQPGALPPPAEIVPPPPGSPLSRSLLGIQIHGHLTDAQFEAMLNRAQDLGVGWIKLQIDWRLHEPERGQFSEFHRAKVLNVQRASIRGFKTLLSFAKAPDWARPASVRGSPDDGPPDDPQDFANFVAQFMREAKPEFIDAIEIWNEPNLIREWRGKPIGGAEYMKYFRAAYEVIQIEQRAQPSALKPNHRITVISAGPAPTVTFPDGSTMGDRQWLQQLYDNGLANIGPDVAVGAHPYGWANPPDALCCTASPGVTGWYEHPSFYFRETLSAYRQIMERNGHAAARLWVTEFGWATYDGLKRSDGSPAQANPAVGWQTLINQQQQAEYVVRAFVIAQQPPYSSYVGPMMLWNLNFTLVPGMIDASREEAGFALLDGAGHPRPVFLALRNAPKME